MSRNKIPTEHDEYIDSSESNTSAQNDDFIDMWAEIRKQNDDSKDNGTYNNEGQGHTSQDDNATHNREYMLLRNYPNDDRQQNNTTSVNRRQNQTSLNERQQNNISRHDPQQKDNSVDDRQQNNTSSHDPQNDNTSSHDSRQNNILSDSRRKNITSSDYLKSIDKDTSSQDRKQNDKLSEDRQLNNKSSDKQQQIDKSNDNQQQNSAISDYSNPIDNNTSSDDRQQNVISSNNKEHNKMHRYKLSVAIDFGTTTSAMAYSYFNKQDEIHVFTDYSDGVATHGKIPTAILFDKKKVFISFGNNALRQYHNFAAKKQHNDVHLFRNFKMCLYDEKKITEDMMIEDVSGKKMNAMDVFVAALKYFKDTLEEDMKRRMEVLEVQEHDVHWMVTVPAIWCDRAREFMRKAAERAGCFWKFITIALEPEAASIYCRNFSIDKDKENRNIAEIKQPKYLVIDIGGGTLDISAHEVEEEGTIKEIYRTSGNDLGGVKVDDEFEKLLEQVLSKKHFKQLKQKSYEFTTLMQEFQSSKQTANYANDQDVSINVAQSIQKHFKKVSKQQKQGLFIANGRLFISHNEIIKLIEPISQKIQSYIASLLKENDQLKKLDFLILVGGFSNSKIVVNDIKNIVKIPVIVPEHAELCVVKGAVLFGWKEDVIRSRKSRKTYGFGSNDTFIEGIHDEKRALYDLKGKKRCKHCFHKIITINDDVPTNDTITHKMYHAHLEADILTSIPLFSTENPNPMYDDVDGVTFVGKICIPKPKGARGKDIDMEVYFGQTEITVIVKDKHSGKTFKGNFGFLSNDVLKVVDC